MNYAFPKSSHSFKEIMQAIMIHDQTVKAVLRFVATIWECEDSEKHCLVTFFNAIQLLVAIIILFNGTFLVYCMTNVHI